MGQEHPTVLLTGGTSGIGRAAARQLAERGATVLITGRRRQHGEAALAEIRDAHPDDAGAFYQVDFAELDAVRELAETIETDYDRLDVLVNNAGTGRDTRVLTDDGIELTFAVNYVAPFLLTNLLVPRLRESAPARVLNTVTLAKHMREADFKDLDTVATGEYEPFEMVPAYLNSKLALLVFTYELADRLAGTGVKATCFNPGLVGSTDVTRNAPFGGTKLLHWVGSLVARIRPVGPIETEESAGEMLTHHALDQDLPDGEGTYFGRWHRADPGPRAHDEELRDQLWEYTASLADLSKPVTRM